MISSSEKGAVGENKFKITLPLNSMSHRTHESTINESYVALIQIIVFGGPRGDDVQPFMNINDPKTFNLVERQK